MIKPFALKPGDKIGIVATARRVHLQDIEIALQILNSWGLEVVLSPHLFNDAHSYLAGTDEQRIAALQQFLDDPSIAAVLCARGGYGTTRIIDQIEFTEFKKRPKWIVGFSDVTTLHLKILSLGYQSIHGTMPILFSKADAGESVESLRKALFDEPVDLSGPEHPGNKHGKARGLLAGGNLSLIVDSLGTNQEIDTKGKILIMEEVDEYLYRIDRMIVQLKRAGKLNHLAGLVIGHFSEIKDAELPFGESFEDIVLYHTREFNYPIAFGFPVGHKNPNFSWKSGGLALLEVTPSGSVLKHER